MSKTACTYRLSEEALAAIEQIAKATGLSATAVVETTLREAARRQNARDIALMDFIPTSLDAAGIEPQERLWKGRKNGKSARQFLAREKVSPLHKPGKARTK